MKMKMRVLGSFLLLAAVSSAFCDNRWISGVTVKAIKSRPGTNATYFLINEGSGGAYSKWYFDNSSSGGKAILSSLLMALSAGTPITFHESSCSSQWSECDVDELLIGNQGPF